MIRLIGAELLKIRSTRMWLGMLVLSLGFSLLGLAVYAAFGLATVLVTAVVAVVALAIRGGSTSLLDNDVSLILGGTVLAFVAIHHAASTLLAAGTEEQRRRHLPAILDGEIWVQGFSEPGAGSDLAALSTTARRQGDTYVVNGQKLWANGAAHADWCLLLARTDAEAPRRRGISYFLLDMRTPGIDVRPIRQATGDSHFCEMFLNDVAVPGAHLIGPENDGWRRRRWAPSAA